MFADYGSTDTIPIWEDTIALLYWRLDSDCPPDEERLLAAGVLQRLRAAGVAVRVDFYHGSFDPEPPDRDADPVASVDRDQLPRVLRAPAAAIPSASPP